MPFMFLFFMLLFVLWASSRRAGGISASDDRRARMNAAIEANSYARARTAERRLRSVGSRRRSSRGNY